MKITSPPEGIGTLQLSSPPRTCLGSLQPPTKGSFACSGRGGGADLCHNPTFHLHRAVIATRATELLAHYTQPQCGFCYPLSGCTSLGFRWIRGVMNTGCSRHPLLPFMCCRELQRVRMDHELQQCNLTPLPPNMPTVGSREDNTLEVGSISIKALFEIGFFLSYCQNWSALWKATDSDELTRLCLQITSVTEECTERSGYSTSAERYLQTNSKDQFYLQWKDWQPQHDPEVRAMWCPVHHIC